MSEQSENDRPDREPPNDAPDQDAIESPDPSAAAPYTPADDVAEEVAGTDAESGTDAPGSEGAPAGVAAESGTDAPIAAAGAETDEPAHEPAGHEPFPGEADQPQAQAAPEAELPADVPGAPPDLTERPSESPQPAQAGPAAGPPAEPGPGAAPPAEPPAEAAGASAAVQRTEEDEEESTPRVKPEIPGADLVPDIVPEGQEFLDAEAQAAAEAEAEALAAREDDHEDTALPIADAAIDLAAGARYTATGKRKTAVARVILKPGSGTYSINGKPLEQFFPRETLQRIIRQPLETVGYESRMDVVARMHGGGVAAQAGALRHGISRALIVADPNLRGELKRRGFLTRDPRVKERKKAGLKKARKRPQFSKR